MSEEMKEMTAEEAPQTMEGFAEELEASYKAYDEKGSNKAAEAEGPDAEKWAELTRKMEEKVVSTVKIKEAVKAGVIAYLDDIQGFIPASQISTRYVEKLEDWVGKTIEVVPITVDLARKRLVLSGRVVQKEKEAAQKAARQAALKVGNVLKGTVDGIKDYGAFIKLECGATGLLHVSQISKERVKSPAAVLKEGQEVTVKVIKTEAGKISLSIKALTEEVTEKAEEVFNYHETGRATTGLGDLLKNIKL